MKKPNSERSASQQPTLDPPEADKRQLNKSADKGLRCTAVMGIVFSGKAAV